MDRFTINIVYMLMSGAIIWSEVEPSRGRTEMFQWFILQQKYTRCSEFQPRAHLTCRVYDEYDEKSIGNTCFHQPCMDSSFNKTCLPMPTGFGEISSYICVCRENKKPQVTSAQYTWIDWYPLPEDTMYREMKYLLVTDATVLAKEYMWVISRLYLIKYVLLKKYTGALVVVLYWKHTFPVNKVWIQ